MEGATENYLATGNSVCGTPPDTNTGLTREEEREIIREALLKLAKTGFIQVDEYEQVIIPDTLTDGETTYWICGYFTTNETKELWQELQKAYNEGGDNLFNMACLASDNDRMIGAAA